ncbi:hypothetical protein B0H17DRAFT_1141799 [Mycena rosella]|uniref:Uncharacterized protein n=1 Tax=Mycena rosella TaxID=1033263 RepID=A0AAD7CYQ8_MYCRO|nr:hypothetical protein B0H17DRAFT_1141799 [Mycena rosella]
MLDSCILDLLLNKIFLGEEVPLTVVTLKHSHSGFHGSWTFTSPGGGGGKGGGHRQKMLSCRALDDLALDFTIPGYDIELQSGNVEEYIHEVLDATIGQGAQLQAKALHEGILPVQPVVVV